MLDNIQVTMVQNPWEPYDSRAVSYINPNGAMKLLDVATRAYPLALAEGLDIVASVNGRVVDSKKEAELVYVNPGDNVVFSVVPAGGGGGGGGKNPLKMVAMIAITALAMWAGQVYLPALMTGGTAATTVGGVALSEFSVAAMGYTLTTAGYITCAAASFAISTIGGMLVNAILPTSVPSTSIDGLDAATASPTYSWDTGNNATQEGRALPVIYGSMRITPPLISKHISQDGEDQYLYLLYALCDGEIDSVGSIEINGEPISHFEGVSTEVRLGTNDQELVPYFNDTYTDHSVNTKVETSIISTTTGNSANAIGVGVSFPYGLYWSNDAGGLSNNSCKYQIHYRKQGETDWILLVEDTATAAQRENYRKYYRVDNLDPAVYEIKVTRISGEDATVRYSSTLYFEYFQEIMYDDFTYPNTALLALKMLANSQLSGGLPTVTCVPVRSTVKVWNGSEYVLKPASTPAWACYDALHNDLYGMNVGREYLPYKEFLKWATWTDGKGITCNIYLDTILSLLTALAQMSVLGRATVIQRGLNYGVIVDSPATPVQTFTIGNMNADSFTEDFINLSDLANAVELTYWPSEKNYERTMLEVRARDYDESTVEPKKAQVTLLGCTDTTTALRHARFTLNCNEHLRRTVKFDAAVDAIACQPGDVVRVQHDVPQWGYGGRVVSAGAQTVKLDQKVFLGANKIYSILIRQKFEAEEWSPILIYSGGEYVLNDGHIYQATQGSNNKEPAYEEDYWQLVAEKTEQHSIVSVPIDTLTDTLTLTSPWVTVPSRFDLYTFGEMNKMSKDFRIIDISKSQEFVCTLRGLEYRDEVYEDTGDTFEFVQETDLVLVSNLSVREVWTNKNGIGVAEPYLDWRGNAHKWFVYKKRTSSTEPWSLCGETYIPHFNVSDCTQGTQYDFLVTTSTIGKGKTCSLFFIGHPPVPNDMVGFHVDKTVLGPICGWTLDPTPWVQSYDISVDGVVKETGYSGNSYSLDPLLAGDHSIRVRARDVFGQTGNWSLVDVHIDAPGAPSIIAAFVGNGIKYDITPGSGDFSVGSYLVREGESWGTATEIGEISSSTLTTVPSGSGLFRRWFAAKDIAGNVGTPVSCDMTVVSPLAPVVAALISGGNIEISWVHNPGSFGIGSSSIYHGDTFETSTLLSQGLISTSLQVPGVAGTHRFWVQDQDLNGNKGSVGMVELQIVAPSAPAISAQVVTNNVLLTITGGKQTLPLARYRLRKGASWDSGTEIGTITSNFTTVFESYGGNFTYWAAAEDIAGNLGTPSSYSVFVSEPPNFVLLNTYDSPLGGTKTNCLMEQGVLLMPVNTSESFQSHFTGNGWSTPQNQIDAGFPYFLEPTPGSSNYEEVIDYGMSMVGTKITVTPTSNIITGSVSLSCNIKVSDTSSSGPWTDMGDNWSVYASNFRYAKITITATPDGGSNDLIGISGINVTLNIQSKTDGGMGTANASDVGGTQVTFNSTFLDIDYITLTPGAGNPAVRWIYDFSDTPNPTGFKALFYDGSGNRVSGPFSWNVGGK